MLAVYFRSCPTGLKMLRRVVQLARVGSQFSRIRTSSPRVIQNRSSVQLIQIQLVQYCLNGSLG